MQPYLSKDARHYFDEVNDRRAVAPSRFTNPAYQASCWSYRSGGAFL